MIIITTLAEYQTRFWLKVGLNLQARGEGVLFLSFDDRSCDMLDAAGMQNFNVPALARRCLRETALNHAEVFSRFGMDQINYWTSHERITFSITDTATLNAKLAGYLLAIDEIVAGLEDRRDVCVVQELGGFLSVIATWFVARRQDLDNYFLEPSYFRGRMFALKNSFAAPVVSGDATQPVSAVVRSYLEEAIASQTIVIPKKDRHQYSAALAKVLNTQNIKRAMEKIIDKYVLRKHQEFGYIWRYISIHLRMLVNAFRMRGHYTPFERLGDFVYFPFHVPGDVALTLRSPEYLDQLALVEYLVRMVPQPYKVAVKEHPAQIGAVPAGRLQQLLRQYDNLCVIPPGTNNYKVLGAAAAIVSINSKSGAEAGMLGKPVLVLGDAFYKDSPLVERVTSIQELPEQLSKALASGEPPATDRFAYFQQVWEQTLPGELYVEDDDEVKTFANSLLAFVGKAA